VGPVRRATPRDAGRLSLLLPAVHDWHAARYPDVFLPNPDPVRVTEHFAKLAEDPNVSILLSGDPPCAYAVCILQDRPAGLVTHPWRRLLIDQVATDPDHRREGHGRALFDAARNLARDLGCDEIVLDTWGDNIEAHAFFRAMGFAPQRHLFARKP